MKTAKPCSHAHTTRVSPARAPEPPLEHAGHQDRARPRAARQRGARAALPHLHARVAAAEDLRRTAGKPLVLRVLSSSRCSGLPKLMETNFMHIEVS